ncbi:hypothetical protein TSOC_001623 [Tetrabaena socialis]|uniref:Uncharacterized protein n=1 Tax=Tetrabaena socialis TaxID=47790 RepID=A0A2J8AG86_9CHLO|nr:hypothetical protein TSOC_001623 [Tetrabaena socialis]|eukprot:PNH11506.1 hypothetical protein TSOC_001623 [Tetrabaena socialis]
MLAYEAVYYPFNYVLPSGLLFTFCGRTGFILEPSTNLWLQSVPKLRGYASTQFPFTGSSVMLGLYPDRGYQVEIMLFGGQKESTTHDLSTVANRAANRIKLFYDASIRNYTFAGWDDEQMGMGRVMPDSVLLPNGRVIVLNGANTGLAGDSSSGGDSRANFPVLFAEEYNPDAPRGQRFRRMAFSLIARMYHSTACLTTNGTVIIAGCDRCYRFMVTDGWDYVPSPTSKAEYRVEIFSPTYFFQDNVKPAIVDTQSGFMDYDGTFSVTFAFPSVVGGGPGGAPFDVAGRGGALQPGGGRPAGRGNGGVSSLRVTSAVLVAPCSCTHSFNTHQRLVGLRIVSNSASDGSLVVRGPPDINVAPPGMYMLFLLNGNVYSRASWVTLRRP